MIEQDIPSGPGFDELRELNGMAFQPSDEVIPGQPEVMEQPLLSYIPEDGIEGEGLAVFEDGFEVNGIVYNLDSVKNRHAYNLLRVLLEHQGSWIVKRYMLENTDFAKGKSATTMDNYLAIGLSALKEYTGDSGLIQEDKVPGTNGTKRYGIGVKPEADVEENPLPEPSAAIEVTAESIEKERFEKEAMRQRMWGTIMNLPLAPIEREVAAYISGTGRTTIELEKIAKATNMFIPIRHIKILLDSMQEKISSAGINARFTIITTGTKVSGERQFVVISDNT